MKSEDDIRDLIGRLVKYQSGYEKEFADVAIFTLLWVLDEDGGTQGAMRRCKNEETN